MRGRNTGKCWYRTKHTGNKAEQVVARPTNQPTDLRRFNNFFSGSFLFFSASPFLVSVMMNNNTRKPPSYLEIVLLPGSWKYKGKKRVVLIDTM